MTPTCDIMSAVEKMSADQSNTRGFLIPRFTTAYRGLSIQRWAALSIASGALVGRQGYDNAVLFCWS